MNATIYHNPRCSKSRAALALLTQAGATITIVEYLKTPLDAETLEALFARAGIGPRDALRTGETEAKALKGADNATTLAAMARYPILIERPIVATAKGVVIARPPERALELL